MPKDTSKNSAYFCRIVGLIEKAYGRPPAMRRTDPVDELVRTILSQNTTDKNSRPAFAALKRRFTDWAGLVKAAPSSIAVTIRHAGLARIKAGRIRDALAEIIRREGRLSLANLKQASIEDGLEYLESLKGVGPKTASCVLLFSFGKPAMPVDTHIYRVAKRLKLISEKTSYNDAHRVLSKAVPKGLIYRFHLGIIEHGRRTCKAQSPRCGSCVIYGLCRFKGKSKFVSRGSYLVSCS